MNRERVRLIDGMRGWSLFGILLANLLIFQYGMFGKDVSVFTGMNKVFYDVSKIVIEGSFMPIFTFLFGYSMIKMSESLRANGLPVKRFFIRRFILLGAIGLAHSTFLWEGDILFFYGLMGFFLLIFVNRKTKTILIWGLLLYILTLVIPLFGVNMANTTAEDFNVSTEYVQQTNDVYANGTYFEIKEHRNHADPFGDIPEAFLLILLLLTPIFTSPLFLFGMYAARIGMFADPGSELRGYRFWTILILPLGLLVKTAGHFHWFGAWAEFFASSGGPLLGVGYISAFAWFYAKRKDSLVVRTFENTGKLSLTNYLLQSVVCTSAFYGYGLGWFGKIGIAEGIAFGILLFSLQCLLSSLYLKKLRRGPVEFLLRMVTNFSWSGKVRPGKGEAEVDDAMGGERLYGN